MNLRLASYLKTAESYVPVTRKTSRQYGRSSFLTVTTTCFVIDHAEEKSAWHIANTHIFCITVLSSYTFWDRVSCMGFSKWNCMNVFNLKSNATSSDFQESVDKFVAQVKPSTIVEHKFYPRGSQVEWKVTSPDHESRLVCLVQMWVNQTMIMTTNYSTKQCLHNYLFLTFFSIVATIYLTAQIIK